MSTLYVINLLSNSSGHHTVHKYGCPKFPDNFYELGLYDSCASAVLNARDIHPDSTCCPICISGCKDPEHHEKHKNKLLNQETE